MDAHETRERVASGDSELGASNEESVDRGPDLACVPMTGAMNWV